MPSFWTIWANHPANATPPVIYPCASDTGTPHFENQCAVRLGVALARSGVSMSSYTGTFCWHKHGREHPLRALDMQKWLNDSRAFGKVEIARRTASKPLSHAAYLGRTGIALWLNFWGTNSQGDHIDLWNGAQIAKGELDYFSRSEQVHFWPIG